MRTKIHLLIAVKFTLVTTLIFGVLYPLGITGLSQAFFSDRANGQLLTRGGQTIGSRIIGQTFVDGAYFHSRPSSAGTGYDAWQSSGSNFAPTNRHLLERVNGDVGKLRRENPDRAIPIDLVTASASGLDPEISPAAAEFQIPRIARERGTSETNIRGLVAKHTLSRQFGFLGEPRVRVLELNLALDAVYPKH
jgi:potassium-transporting ATPase KdpC subunit